VVVICNKLESEIIELEDDERAEFLADLGMEEPGLNRVIRAGYELLHLHTYFTAGPKEVRAWTVKVGATAPEAAGVIHTDFQKGFIRAEVIGYDDFIAHGGEQGAKEAGKLAPRGQGLRRARRRRDPLPLQRLRIFSKLGHITADIHGRVLHQISLVNGVTYFYKQLFSLP
jgi:hypothetical protein